MKKLTLLVASLLLTITTFGQGISFFEGSYTEALELATEENKSIFVDVYTSWCGPCRMMSMKTFTDNKVGDYYNNNFISLKIDAEKESDSPFFEKYQASSYPSYFWVDSNGDLLLKGGGYMEPPQFLELSVTAKESHFTNEAKVLEQRWNSGERTVELLNDYVYSVVGTLDPQSVSGLVIEFLDSKSDEELKSAEIYPILLSTVSRGLNDSKYSKLSLANADIYKNYGERYEYWERMYRIIVRAGSMKYSRAEEYNQHIENLRAANADLATMYEEILNVESLIFDGKFSEVIPQIIPLVERYSPEHNYLYKQLFYTLIIGDYFTKAPLVDEQNSIIREIATRAMSDQPCKENLMYIAATYAKEGDYNQAYQCLSSLPFFDMPMLSNALYKRLNINFYGSEFR